MGLDIPGGHASGKQGNDAIIEAMELLLTLLDQLRLKSGVAVTGDFQLAFTMNATH